MTETTLDAPVKHRARLPERTLRTDRWWRAPALTFAGIMSFLIYGFWAIFDKSYFVEPYLAPFSSPCLAESCPEGARPFGWAPVGSWWVLPPGILILGLPTAFRLTCYYYRRSYYRSFWLSPPACAVPDKAPVTTSQRYTGETRFPLILQNIHRYSFYGALLIAAVLMYDAVLAFRDSHGAWGHLGVGALVLWANVILIWAYTISCHSCRHIVGGRLKNFSKHPVRYRLWTFVSRLNARHMQLAWWSMYSVMFADLYVRLVAKGIIPDIQFF
jgi:hypothetical protein